MKRSTGDGNIRIGADIGGTFTDIALDLRGEFSSVKVLTDQQEPEKAVLQGIRQVTRQADVSLADLDMIVHGTTLATNALIERRGAKTAFITTDGFRDVIEMRTENRFDQYDLNITFSPPLIARQHRYPIKGRIDAAGRVLQHLDENAIEQVAQKIAAVGYESVAIGFIHSYLNPTHELRAREILHPMLSDIPISLSAEVAPQMREYSRFSTVCANAYVRPRIERYLTRLQDALAEHGVVCPLFVIHSAGGLISIDSAKAYPVRLIESGPAGGANFAARTAARFGMRKAVSFDMGGTTAKICLIEDGSPEMSREFEVARSHRFRKGSGMPILIPVIKMIEIGAGGGSIARVDDLGRIQVGPESAGSEPGPACYQRGGRQATVTDADVVLGRIDPNHFAGGSIALSKSDSRAAVRRDVGDVLSLDAITGAFGISEVVDENMANAARVHAVENGRHIADYTMIAFGGAAPLHAARICEKLGIVRCLIPRGAGVGSAIGFLQTPFSYESVVSRIMGLKGFDAGAANKLVTGMIDSAEQFVAAGTRAATTTHITAYMRYRGQGWEVPVPLPNRIFTSKDTAQISQLFEECYAKYFGRTIDMLDDLEIEIVSWAVRVVEDVQTPVSISLLRGAARDLQFGVRSVYETETGHLTECRVIQRDSLPAGVRVGGPLMIVERETTTSVTAQFDAVVQSDGSILLTAKEG